MKDITTERKQVAGFYRVKEVHILITSKIPLRAKTQFSPPPMPEFSYETPFEEGPILRTRMRKWVVF